MATKIELEVSDIHAGISPSEACSLILKEKNGARYVPIIIGISEARAILVELNNSPTHRPLTHELFFSLAENYHCNLVEVDITHYENGIYIADVMMMRDDQTTFHIDARPSDAIALALKAHAPFFMDADIFDQNCNVDDNDDEEEAENVQDEILPDEYITQKLTEMSSAELERLLEGAIASEDFELAAQIQEELQKRK